MKVIRGLINVPKMPKGSVVTFGNFDSVHRGHQSIISRVVEEARRRQIPSCVMTFEPQPEEFFRPSDCPARLTRLREKLECFEALQVDYAIVLRFDRSLILYTAQPFLEEILINRLHMQHLVVGEDCRFGMNQQGNIDFLQQWTDRYHFTLELSQTLFLQSEGPHDSEQAFFGCRISSTLVRQVLQEGNLRLASRLLGRPFCMNGRVVHGKKLARSLDFPTANIYLHRKKSPLNGVYQVKVRGIGKRLINGIANVGYRPTAKRYEDSFQKLLLEVHLFNFHQDIYGKHLEVEFIKKVRDERCFESFEALKKQIELDVKQVRIMIEME